MLIALRLITIGDKEAIASSARKSERKTRLLLDAVLSQYAGDVNGAIQSLKHQLKGLVGLDRAVVADVLAPMLLMRHDYELIPGIAALISEAGMRGSSCALRAVLYAENKQRAESRQQIAKGESELALECNEVIRLRVLQRLGRASLILKESEKALDFASEGAALSSKLGSSRSAAANYSVCYNVHHAITGQLDEARRFAHLWYTYSARCSDASFMRPALIAEYEMAVHFAEDTRIRQLEQQIQLEILPQQYAERFSFAMSYALVRGANDPAAMRTLLHVLVSTPQLTHGQRSLCLAFIALADAGSLEDGNARRNIRDAITLLGRPTKGEPAHEVFVRRVARATVAIACVLIGDDVRANRLLEVNELRDVPDLRQATRLVRLQAWEQFAPQLRGVASVFRKTWEQRIATTPSAALTAAEMDVLRLLERGWSAGRIASETQRSVNTIYNHTRAILAKLEASRAAEAVAIARERGLLH